MEVVHKETFTETPWGHRGTMTHKVTGKHAVDGIYWHFVVSSYDGKTYFQRSDSLVKFKNSKGANDELIRLQKLH